MIQKYLILAIFLSWSAFSFAAYKEITVDESRVSRVDYADKANIVIFGGSVGCNPATSGCSTTGYFGECATLSGTATCNSCTGLTDLSGSSPFYKCAYKNVYGSLKIRITFTVDSVPSGATLKVQWQESSGTSITPSNSPTVAANTPITVEFDWNAICQAEISTNCDAQNADDSFSDTLLIGVTADALTTSNAMKFTVKWRNRDGENSTFINLCDASDAGSGDPFCYFTVLPGDKKVFITDLARGSAGTTDDSGMKWMYARVYYAQSDCTLPCNPDFTTIPLGAGATYEDLTITNKTDVATSLSNNKVTSSLENDVDYKFNLATVDEGTIVVGFIDPASLTGTKHATRPGEVTGLLDNKHCFVATAAYGSDMAAQVVWLRQFRNQFLLTTSWGRSLVKFYYQHSPRFAEIIAQNSLLRALARGYLWPLVFLAYLLVHLGLMGTLSGFVFFSIVAFLGLRRLQRFSLNRKLKGVI